MLALETLLPTNLLPAPSRKDFAVCGLKETVGLWECESRATDPQHGPDFLPSEQNQGTGQERQFCG